MIILARHYYTEVNKNGLIQTIEDHNIKPIPNEIKKKFNDKISSFNLKCCHIYCSEYKRTQQTAKEIGYSYYTKQSFLNEIALPKIEGQPRKDYHLYKKYLESIELDEREFMSFFSNLDPDFDYIMFSHGLKIKYILKYFLKSSLSVFDLFNRISLRPLGMVILGNRFELLGIENIIE